MKKTIIAFLPVLAFSLTSFAGTTGRTDHVDHRDNLRSNKGGKLRGHDRADYVHKLNKEKRDARTADKEGKVDDKDTKTDDKGTKTEDEKKD